MPAGSFRLDVFTLSAMTVANLAMVALGTLFAWLADRSVDGMRRFSVGLLVMCLGALANTLRNTGGGDFIVLGGNILTFTGVVLLMQGLRRLRGATPFSPRFITISSVVCLIAYCWLLFVHDSLALRVAVLSPFYSVFAFAAAEAMLLGVPRSDRVVYWPSGIALALHGVVLVTRAEIALSGGFGDSIFAQNPIQMISIVSFNFAIFACGISLITGSNLHLRRQAEALALYDPLTHLPNRRLFLDRLAQAEKRAAESGERLAIVYLDLDGFKDVNDTRGHQAGDEMLKRVAGLLRASLSECDCLARIGGDEFVALVENVGSREAIAPLKDRLRAAIATETGVSCGLAIFPDDGRTGEAVVREADAAMYQAKRERRFMTAALH